MDDLIMGWFLAELRSDNCSVETLASLVREYGGDGDLLWAYADLELTTFDICILSLSEGAAFSDRMLVDLIRWLVNEYPGLPSTEDTVRVVHGEYRHTLLQRALDFRAPWELVRLLVNVNRDILTTPDTRGNLPIHYACFVDDVWRYAKVKGLDLETVRFLAEADPATLQVRRQDGKLPLHSACNPYHFADKYCPEVLKAIQVLIDAYPDALNATDDDGETPILIATRTEEDLYDLPREVLQFLPRMIEYAPDSVRVEHTNEDGSVTVTTALHRALKSSPNTELLSSMIKACPRALDDMDCEGRLPLHVACSRFVARRWEPDTIEVIQLLIGAHPTALEARDNGGRTPVMIAIDNTRGPVVPDVIQFLQGVIERAPNSVRGRYRSLWTPTHLTTALVHACDECCEPGFVSALIKAYPESLAVKDRNHSGGIPLHVVFASSRFIRGDPVVLEATRLLIDAHPASLKERDVFGRTPIMVAFFSAYGKFARLKIQKGAISRSALNFMVQCIWQAPDSVRGAFKLERGPFTTTTVLEQMCARKSYAMAPIIMEAWPFALCVRPTCKLRGLPSETKAGALDLFLALTEVLLHDTTRVPEPIRRHIRRVIAERTRRHNFNQGGSIAQGIRKIVLEQLRKEVLNDNALQAFLLTKKNIQDFVIGVYRMNKAGRTGRSGLAWDHAPEDVTVARHIRILEAADGNLNCLFLHLCGSASLFNLHPRENRCAGRDRCR